MRNGRNPYAEPTGPDERVGLFFGAECRRNGRERGRIRRGHRRNFGVKDFFFLNVTVLCYNGCRGMYLVQTEEEVSSVETDLISKKELLELTGISYGQLYRWKRKKLIPEEWFIRKSTFTGQETFFPRDKVLARIEKIKNMKEDLSLDEIAELLSPLPIPRSVKRSEVAGLVSETTLRWFTEKYGDPEEWEFGRVLSLYVLDRLVKTGEISLAEGETLYGLLGKTEGMGGEKGCELIFFRKMGVSGFALIEAGQDIRFDDQVKIPVRLQLSQLSEELKIKLI